MNIRLYFIDSGVYKMDWGIDELFWGIDESFWGEGKLMGGLLAKTWEAGHVFRGMIIFFIAVFKLALGIAFAFWGCSKSLWGGWDLLEGDDSFGWGGFEKSPGKPGLCADRI